MWGGLLAGGLGALSGVADSMDKREAAERELQRRRMELEEQRAIRERERREDKDWREQQDRLYRRQLGIDGAQGGLLQSGSRSTGARSGVDEAAYRRDAYIAEGATPREADMLARERNPYSTEKVVAGDLPDGSDAEVTGTPNEEKFRQMLSVVSSRMNTMREGANAEHGAKARQIDQITAFGQSAETGRIKGLPNVEAAATAGARVIQGRANKDESEGGVLDIPSGTLTETDRSRAAAEKARREPTAARDRSIPSGDATLTDIRAEIKRIDEQLADRKAKLTDAERQELVDRRQELQKKRVELQGTGKPGGGAVLKSLPPGAKQIGTSNGKPVYQTPDGKRFIGG